MTSIMLSKRLLQLVQCIPPQSRVADIGTDHANVPIFLVQNQLATQVIAADIGKRPLEGARRHIETRLGLSHGIELRCGGGLTVLKSGEVDTVIIAGMGGQRIQAILSDHLAHSHSFERFVLQPNKGWTELRQFLWANGFAIQAEHMLAENKQIFLTLVVVVGEQDGDYLDAVGGPLLRQTDTAVRRLWLSKRSDTLRGILEKHPERPFLELRRELDAVMTLIRECTGHD